jgi:hypothetical protein
VEPYCSAFCRVRDENGSFRERKNDSTTHMSLDQEEECLDDDDIIGMYTVCDVVCNSTIIVLIRQLVEKRKLID